MTTTERRVKRVATPELSLVHIPTILVTILLPPDGSLGVTNSLQTARREEKCGAKLCNMLHTASELSDRFNPLNQHFWAENIIYYYIFDIF